MRFAHEGGTVTSRARPLPDCPHGGMCRITERTMNRSSDSGGLNRGGPSDQASIRPDAQDEGRQGSQSGRPQRQAAEQPTADEPSRGGRAQGVAASDAPEDTRGVSETEREAGTPDPRATTDWTQGEK
jgi:hypothetical protein